VPRKFMEKTFGDFHGLALHALLASVVGGEDFLQARDGHEGCDELLCLGGVAPVFEGVEVAFAGSGTGPLSSSGHGGPPFMGTGILALEP